VGILLGGMAEDSLIFTYQISGGLWSYLFQRPIAMFILVLLCLSLFGSQLFNGIKKVNFGKSN
jgi:putative tricarboxylic transport membrane protein